MFRTTFAVLYLCGWCSAQTPTDPKPEFEVATVKASAPDPRGYIVTCTGGPGSKDPELFRCQNMSIANLISRAYDIPHYRLSGPDWMDSPLFQINARVPAGTTKEQFQAMLQNMLADRLKLTIHHETRELPIYEMVVAKGGPKFKPAAEAPPPSSDVDAPRRPPAPSGPRLDNEGYPILTSEGMAMTNGKARMYQPRCTMETLASRLAGQVGKPVTDATGLKGKYEITLYWATGDGPRRTSGGATSSSEPETAAEPDSAPTLLRAIQDQLGLRLEPKRGPVDFIVIDHAEKTPIEN